MLMRNSIETLLQEIHLLFLTSYINYIYKAKFLIKMNLKDFLIRSKDLLKKQNKKLNNKPKIISLK
jgi:hypothetical protein